MKPEFQVPVPGTKIYRDRDRDTRHPQPTAVGRGPWEMGVGNGRYPISDSYWLFVYGEESPEAAGENWTSDPGPGPRLQSHYHNQKNKGKGYKR